MTWVYLFVGIVCLIALQSLRSVLSMEFPIYKSFRISQPKPNKFGGLDLIDAKTQTLSALGFEGPEWIGSSESSAAFNAVSAHAVYRNSAEHVIAWLGPTLDLARPNQLLTYYTTLLEDGRYAVTQVGDSYFESVQDPRTPAQTIADSDAAKEISLHKRFVASLGAPAAELESPEGSLYFAGEHMNSIRKHLLDSGRIVESQGTARPTISFAFKLLKRLRSKPKSNTTDAGPVSTARLTFLSGIVGLAKDRAPSQQMQWLLLLLSSVLFVAIGWPFLGLEFTLVILAVIAFHEAGHWVAMRFFGYRNPHITLLPLLGGVTIGYERDPSAAKRAWVALAGPLPGIVLAWALIYLAGVGLAQAGELTGWVFSTIAVLLFINYLNVLPIPPLDGSHIVQAILPPRWLIVQTLLVLAGVVIGVYVAFLLEFWPLALIAALQIAGLKSLWQTAGLSRKFSQSPPPVELDETARMTWLLTELEKTLGAPKIAVKRIALANTILTQLDTEPMGGMQRTIISSIYLALVIVPIAAIALAAGNPLSAETRPEVEVMYQAIQADYDELHVAVEKLDDATLLEMISDQELLLIPASDDDLAAAEARLGRRLPEHLRDFYALSNGMPKSLGLGHLGNLRAANPETFSTGDLMSNVYEGELYFYDAKRGDITIPVMETENWWLAGLSEDRNSYVYIDPNAKPGDPGVFVFSDYESSAYATIRDLSENTWVEQRGAGIYDEHTERLHATINESMSGLTVAELIDEFPQHGLFERLVTRNFGESGPASPHALTVAEARVGHPLPADYRQMLEIHDGFSPMALLSIEDIQPAQACSDCNLARALDIANEIQPGLLSEQAIGECWGIAGHFRGESYANPDEKLFITLFWCPEMDREYRYLSLTGNGFQESFADELREHAVLHNSF